VDLSSYELGTLMDLKNWVHGNLFWQGAFVLINEDIGDTFAYPSPGNINRYKNKFININ
jgi:hypothetical protein